jgi:hypothetical protein
MLQKTVQYANKYKNLLFQLVYCREYLFYEKFDTCMCALESQQYKTSFLSHCRYLINM